MYLYNTEETNMEGVFDIIRMKSEYKKQKGDPFGETYYYFFLMALYLIAASRLVRQSHDNETLFQARLQICLAEGGSVG